MILIEKLIKNYIRKYPCEKSPKRVLSFLTGGGDAFSNKNWLGHFTGSAWVVSPKKNKVLLTHHKILNKWLQLGGHADGEQNLLNVAIREAKEESGMTKIAVIDEQIFDMDIHRVFGRKNEPSHLHYDVRFIFEANPKNENIVVSSESFGVEWIPIDKISKLNPEKSIERMIKKTRLLPF